MFLALGKIVEKPVVKDGKIVIAPMMNLNFTVDHRFIDGGRAKVVSSGIKEVFENPEKFTSKFAKKKWEN